MRDQELRVVARLVAGAQRLAHPAPRLAHERVERHAVGRAHHRSDELVSRPGDRDADVDRVVRAQRVVAYQRRAESRHARRDARGGVREHLHRRRLGAFRARAF